jgi:CPA2 family monovalent cation:H+ antiporter-2
MESFLFQATIYLGAAVLAVPLAARLGLGSVLGYLAAGILIGPVFGLVGAETVDLQHFAEFGVVMMLFLIGLELEPRMLWDMRDRLIGLGGLQVILTMAAVGGGAMLMGYDWRVSVAIAMIFSLSSTAIVLQTLSEKGLTQTSGGRSAFSVLLTQDIAVIPMLAVLPLLGGAATLMLAPDGSIERMLPQDVHDEGHTLSLIEGLPGWGVTLVTLGAVAAVVLAGIYLTRPVFRYIHSARLSEMYTALALLMVVAIAVLMNMVGLSAALGTFLAGVVLANSEFRHQLESDLEPFKGLLLGLFFITVGAGINVDVLTNAPFEIIGLAVGVMAVKTAILYLLARVFRLRRRDRWLFTLGLGQAGEFGFVLTSFAVAQGIFGPGIGERMLLAIAITMLLTPLMFIAYEMISRRMGEEVVQDVEDEIDHQGPVIIAGIGRFGQVVNRLVQSAGFETVVLDGNLTTIKTMRQFGYRSFFGDPTRPDILRAAGLAEAGILVAALDDRAANLRLVKYAREQRPDLHIIARAYDRIHVYELYQAGADDIVREMFDSSLRAGRYVLENLGLTEYEASEAEMMFYHHDRAAMRELAELWKPGVEPSANPEYISRSKELNTDLETALLQHLAKPPKEGETAKQGFQSKPRTPNPRKAKPKEAS